MKWATFMVFTLTSLIVTACSYYGDFYKGHAEAAKIGNMNKNDMKKLNDLFEYSKSGKNTEWVNPDNKNSYSVILQPAFYEKGNSWPCRNAKITTGQNGSTSETRITACRNSLGQWAVYD